MTTRWCARDDRWNMSHMLGPSWSPNWHECARISTNQKRGLSWEQRAAALVPCAFTPATHSWQLVNTRGPSCSLCFTAPRLPSLFLALPSLAAIGPCCAATPTAPRRTAGFSSRTGISSSLTLTCRPVVRTSRDRLAIVSTPREGCPPGIQHFCIPDADFFVWSCHFR